MDFTHYADTPVQLAVNLVNSFGQVSGTEHLDALADLRAFLDEHAGEWRADVPTPRRDDLPAVHRLRNELRQIFEAPDPKTAADRINELLISHRAVPRLTSHGNSPHLHFETTDGTVADWLGVVTAMGLATVIADEGFERLGVCKSGTCRDVFIDSSRNASRRHCSDTCRNRENVAAHRRRRRATS